MTAGEPLVQLWKEWGIQTLVLLSFTLQVVLLILAEFRRSMDSGVLKAFLWPAYMLADSTAIYVLGHLSVTSRAPEHLLIAFWAPFLLLHLGGQDNITAYAVEDNELWLRHLETLAVQVAAAAYVLYESFIIGGRFSLLLPAAIVMFAVGVLKYGERVWALKCASSSASGNNYRSLDRITATAVGTFTSHRDTEGFLSIAHRLLAVPMDLLKGPSRFVDLHYSTSEFHVEELYKVAEMQLSLMHDVFYTKAEVTHTWYGLFIRVFSPLGTAAALVLFLLQGDHRKRNYSRIDIAITYVLLVGAVVLEITSALRAIFSSWTCALLDKWEKGRNVWHFVASLRRLVHVADWRRRYWSGTIGQHNLLELCAKSWASKRSKIAKWLGVEDPWNTFAYSFTIPVSESIKKLLISQVLKGTEEISDSSPDHIHNSRGRAVLKSWKLYEELGWSVDDNEFDDSIMVWHIATSMYICWYKKKAKTISGWQEDAQLLAHAEAAEGLSNYMLFLLAARPYMLPPPASRNAYVHVCHFLTFLKKSPEDLGNSLYKNGYGLNTTSHIEVDLANLGRNPGGTHRYTKTMNNGTQLGAKLIGREQEGSPSPPADILKMISQVWVEMLCYAGHRCSADSHAKQLSNGGELITISTLLMEHVRRQTSMP